MAGNKRHFLFPLLAAGLGLALVLSVLEAASHFFPVNDQPPSPPVNQADPYLRFIPDQTFTFSNYADFSLCNQSHSNNWGFINDQDYHPRAPLPLVAVIGDSFVEAMMVPYPQTFHALLAKDLEGKARVYSFAKSGAPLSQYLAYAHLAQRHFAPQKMIVVVIDNDFDQSMRKYGAKRGFHQFVEDGGGGLELRLSDLTEATVLSWLTARSRLMKYLIRNVKIDLVQELILGERDQFVRPVRRDEPRVVDSRRAVDAFFRQLPEAAGLGPGQVLLVMDGMRPTLYSDQELAVPDRYFQVMRDYFMEQAGARGYKFIDMQPIFVTDYKKNGRRFEYQVDMHWNPYAHGIVAQGIISSGFLDDLTD